MKDEEARVEAALYASGRPLSLEEIAKAAGTTSLRRAYQIVKKVMERINSCLKAIEVIELENKKFVVQVKPEYVKVAKKFSSKPLLPKSVMKTLTMIAFYQPISALALAAKRGTRVYSHIKLLEALGFIEKVSEQGRQKLYGTTPFFSSYFGLPHDINKLKLKLASLFPKEALKEGKENPQKQV